MPRRKPAPRRATPKWESMDRRTYLRTNLREVHKDIEDARDAASWQAVGTLRMRARDLREELDALDAPKAEAAPVNPFAGKTDEEVKALLRAMVRGLPPALQAELEDELVAARSGRPSLRVVEGG
jgi:hypothetical protein